MDGLGGRGFAVTVAGCGGKEKYVRERDRERPDEDPSNPMYVSIDEPLYEYDDTMTQNK